MVSNRDVLGYLKGNIGEESVLKIISIGAIKSLFSVAIIIAGIVCAMQLASKYGSLTVYSIIITFIFFSFVWCNIVLNGFHDYLRIETDNIMMDHRRWKDIYTIFSIKDLIYYDWGESNADIFTQVGVIGMSGVLGAITVGILMLIGFGLIISGAFIYAFYLSFYVPSESLVTVATIGGSILLMTILFIKLKWRKIFTDVINWNLMAWCACAAVIITVISFVAGVAIRRIAGYIGIEYTIALVSIYVIVTAIYVITDIRQWMDNKSREAAKEVDKNQPESSDLVA